MRYIGHTIVILDLRSKKCKQDTNAHGKEHHRRVFGRAPFTRIFFFIIISLLYITRMVSIIRWRPRTIMLRVIILKAKLWWWMSRQAHCEIVWAPVLWLRVGVACMAWICGYRSVPCLQAMDKLPQVILNCSGNMPADSNTWSFSDFKLVILL